jgi:hypothetical protein
MNHGSRTLAALLATVSGLCATPLLAAESDATSLAKQAQNPVADLVSLPLQLNMNFDAGPEDDLQTILNVQPVVPFSLNDKWNLITRTIVPVISQPDFGVYDKRENGIGDVQFSTFFSPKAPTANGWIWGAGVIAQLDTATDDRLGQGVWGLGPTAVALRSQGSWLFGALINNVWSVSKDNDRSSVNQMLIQPFINYNIPSSPGRYLTFAPIITADWEADSSDTWLVPIGLGIGQITKFGKQPVNLQASYYYNVERPDQAPNYQIRLQIQFLFPK